MKQVQDALAGIGIPVYAISTEVKYDTSDRNENILMTADAFYYHYTQFGGHLQAM